MKFTHEQIKTFQDQGYAILPGLLNEQEVKYLRNFFHDLFASEYWKKSTFNSNSIINDIYRDFPELIDLIFKPKYILAAKELLGDQMVCVPECSVHYNRFFDWHRDTAIMEAQGFFTHKDKRHQLVQEGIYLQENKPEGGGLLLIPGTNRGKDRFIKHVYGSPVERTIQKISRAFHISISQRIEKKENLYLPPTKAGDVLFFDSELDHRASFKRRFMGNARIPEIEKFAIFNGFCSTEKMAKDYLKCITQPDEPYANFLKQTKAPPILIQKSNELALKIEYPQ